MRNRRTWLAGGALVSLFGLTACTQDPPVGPSTVISCTAGPNSTVSCGTGNGTTGVPSPPPTGPFTKPDYVKITQFGEDCPSGGAPSGGDRTVRVGCIKRLTLSPKCKQAAPLPDIDCPVPESAAPEWVVTSGAERVAFAIAGNPFNANATGRAPGLVLISGSYGGVTAQAPFDLTVIP